MTHKHINSTWGFECVLPTGITVQSWFYADSKEDAVRRITEYMGAKLKSLKEIENPLKDVKMPVKNKDK